MIYTVTFNPAIDCVVALSELRMGEVNRAESQEIFIGGKGINVSLVLRELGIASKALGFVAGFTGEAVENGLRAKGVEADFIHLPEGCTRINIKIKDNTETELNGQGPHITEEALACLFDKLDALSDGDTLVLAGSTPRSVPEDVYEQILSRLSGKRLKAVVDASGALLLNVLKYKPFLVKPNIHELGELFGARLHSTEEAELYARRLREMGAVNVLVSMAEKGAMLIDEKGDRHILGVCRGKVESSVGAGDSMVAGFLAGLERGGYDYALRLGTAAGGATAFSKGLGTSALIDELLSQLTLN